MRSTPSDSLAERLTPRLTLSLAALALAASCSPADAPTPTDVHEVSGAVQVWPGEVRASCGDRLALERFVDDVGDRAGSETRALITTAQAYQEYFGHAPPAGVSVGREWVVFYAPGPKGRGSFPNVEVVGTSGDVLHVVTTLTAPIPPCAPPLPGKSSGAGGSSGTGGSAGSANSGSGSASTGSGSAPSGTNTATPGAAAAPVPVGTGPSNPTKPAPDVAPPSRTGAYVLVKFPAQTTHAVDFQHQDINPGCGGEPQPQPQPDPCAAILCGPGQTCSVLLIYPSQARCVDVDASACISSGDCSPGLVCSTELGVCGRNPKCGPNGACDTACWGTCVKKSDPTPADRCTSSASCPKGSRCSTERGDCQGCGGAPGTACPAICFGVCEPESAGVCTGGALMGNCRSEAALKEEAALACKKLNLPLTDFGVGNACFAGGFAAAKYTCCSAGPPPPPAPVPPPAACKADSDCHLVSNTCGQTPCTCAAHAVNQPELACAPAAVMCLVDPCAQKTAACVGGKCTVEAASKR